MSDVTANQNGRHIALVSETFLPEVNGVTNTLKHLCLGLMKQGHRVTVVRPRQARETTGAMLAAAGEALFSAEVLVPGAPLPGYPELRFGLCRSATLARLWSGQRPDAVYIATQGPLGIAAASAAGRLGIPVSSGFHTNFHSYSHYYGAGFLAGLLCRYGRWFHNRTDLTLVPTRRMQRQVRSMGIEACSVWSRGVDCQRFAPHKRDNELRRQWGLGPGDRAIVYVGRLAAEKNLQMAVACYERIRQLHHRARFILVGDGPLRERLAARHPDYIFCGMQQGEALARHYASGDLFLFPSKTDTFGNVVTEAMASGLAVVAYDDAAAGEHLRHEENGMVAALDDDDGFVTSALKLLDQPTLLARVRSQARLDALDLQWSVLVEQFANLILSVQPKEHSHAVKQSLPIL
ncbi:MAG: glycosyltransferase family 1 protein [Marinobacter sp.]|uniref:glycosyltransferase family 4 protein n=1 Tax=Marinobacter sp. TaxID=50741 RepID=UPI00299D8D5C|nr:glycosyltransferase family 1 protein [Marinobacter sp.]MDX1633526.1 glycosyltransferase family 1 protein [Marinobacter sp.]